MVYFTNTMHRNLEITRNNTNRSGDLAKINDVDYRHLSMYVIEHISKPYQFEFGRHCDETSVNEYERHFD